MNNVGDGKVVLKGRHHQPDGCEENYREAGNPGATRGFGQGQSEGPFIDNGDHAYDKGVCTAS
jgi:hypothetical protein